jgi:hypothetical protein
MFEELKEPPLEEFDRKFTYELIPQKTKETKINVSISSQHQVVQLP